MTIIKPPHYKRQSSFSTHQPKANEIEIARLIKLCNEYPSLHTSLIGIYPSLEYPACVYELNTNADRYVSANVLPYTGSALISTVKYLIDKFLGANPAVGGLGLTLYKE